MRSIEIAIHANEFFFEPSRLIRDLMQKLKVSLKQWWLASWLVGKMVGSRRVTEDRYGREVAEPFLSAINVQWEMVASGQPVIYQRYTEHCYGVPNKDYD